MSGKPIVAGKKVYLRSIDKDEKWLQDYIRATPSVLPFDNLVVVSKERKQSSGGRLDLLMRSEDENVMYEIEIMLGDTDPSHIIRSIEYWDIEKRRFPQRQHFAVLVAENFNRRYFNIIQLISLNIPMIAVQLDVLETDNHYTLSFTKIMDIYEEPDDESENVEVKEDDWKKSSPWVYSAANTLLNALKSTENTLTLQFTKHYIAITRSGTNLYFLHKRVDPKVRLGMRISDQELSQKIRQYLDEQGATYDVRSKEIIFTSTAVTAELLAQIQAIHSIRLKHRNQELEDAGEDL